MITTKVGDFVVKSLLVDRNSSHDVLSVDILSNMTLEWSRSMIHANMMAYFSMCNYSIVGNITLPLTLKESLS